MATALEVISRPRPFEAVMEQVLALVLDSVPNAETRRHYGRALVEFQAWRTTHSLAFDRASVHRWRTELEGRGYSPATINKNLSAIRKLAREAAHAGFIDPQTAAGVDQVANVRQSGSHAGNWLTQKQAQALLYAPPVDTLKGCRDRAALALLMGCGLRRSEAAKLTFEHIQQRDGRWVIVDLRGKRGRIRTVPLPAFVKTAIDRWSALAGISTGRVLRGMNQWGRVTHDSISGTAILNIATEYGRRIGVSLKAHDLRRTCAKLCRQYGGKLEQIQLLLGHQSIQTTERYLGTEQDLTNAPNDHLGLRWRNEE